MPGRREIQAGRATVSARWNDTALARGLTQTRRRLQRFGSQIQGVGLGLTALGTAALAPLIAASRSFASVGDNLNKASIRTGVSVEALSELGFAAEQSGADLSTLEGGIRRMQRSITDLGRGLSAPARAFDDLGIRFEDIAQLSPENQISAIADGLQQIEDPTRRASLAMEIFGRAGQRLVPLLAGGSAGIRELREQAQGLDLTISTESAERAARVTDDTNIAVRTLGRTAFSVGDSLSGVLSSAAGIFTRGLQAVRQFIDQNRAAIPVIAGLGATLVGVGGAFLGVAGVAKAFGVVLAGVAVVVSPLGIAIAGATSLIVGITAAFNGGEIAGIRLGDAILRLANNLRVLGVVAPDLAQSLNVQDATRNLNRLTSEVGRARSALEQASTLEERSVAQDAVTTALRNQVEAMRELQAQEEALNALSGSARTPQQTTRERAIRGLNAALGESIVQSRALESELESTLDASFSPETRALVAVEVTGIRESRQRIIDSLEQGVELPVGLDLEIGEAQARIEPLLFVLEQLSQFERLPVDVEARVEANVAELNELLGILGEIESRDDLNADVRVAVSAQRAEIQSAIDEIQSAVTRDLSAQEIIVNPRVVVAPRVSLLGTVQGLLSPIVDTFNDYVQQSNDLNFDLNIFGASSVERERLRIQRTADDLRRAFEEIGQLTPEIEEQIRQKTERELSRAIEIEVNASVQSTGLFDVSLAGRVLQGSGQSEERTARAAEATARSSRESAETLKRIERTRTASGPSTFS